MHTTQLPAKRSRPVGICFRISAKFRRGICAAHSLPQRASEKRPSCTTEHRTCTHKTTFEYNHTNEIYAHRRLLAIKKTQPPSQRCSQKRNDARIWVSDCTLAGSAYACVEYIEREMLLLWPGCFAYFVRVYVSAHSTGKEVRRLKSLSNHSYVN